MGAFEYLSRGERDFVPQLAPQCGDIVESGWCVRLHCTRDYRSRIGRGQPAVLAFIDGAQEKRDAESAGRNRVEAQKRFRFLNAE